MYIKIARFEVERDFKLKLGLDLSGGSHLVFEADTTDLVGADKETAVLALRDVIERRVNLFGVSEPTVQRSSFQGKERIIVELPGVHDTQAAVDLIGRTAQLLFAEDTSTVSGQLVWSKTELTGADLVRSEVQFEQQVGKPVVGLQFNQTGKKKFAEITKRNIGKQVAIVLDDEIISAPLVQEEIEQDAIIQGNFTLDEARRLSLLLNSGALPTPIELVEQRIVGATLGADSIEKSIRAGVVGIVAVCAFMILIYKRPGLIAVIGLAIYAILTLALYKLIPVVLTLPGIAGFLLSVGMAVDANILIFERLKEEVKKGLSEKQALNPSFGRAWDSIRDANIATLLTTFVLANPFNFSFLHTSGPVRGFALTLALGIFVGLFTGIVVTRNLLRIFVKGR